MAVYAFFDERIFLLQSNTRRADFNRIDRNGYMPDNQYDTCKAYKAFCNDRGFKEQEIDPNIFDIRE